MSWQAYVDTQLVASGSVAQAAILDINTATVWACTTDFMPRGYEAPVTQEDGNERNEMINEAANLVSLMATGVKPSQGLRLNGEKYQILRTIPEPFGVYAKKPKGGACITKTNLCIIVGTYSEDLGQTSSGCNIAVENLAEYLRSAGC